MDTKYSVLMSVYYKEKAEYLRQSIESVLNQTIPTDDFVIVCDGPLTDELDKVLDFYCDNYPQIINIVRLETNQGLGMALNYGMQYCKNEIVARMDSDDICMPERMERELLKLADKDVDIVSATVIEFVDDIANEISKRQVPETSEAIHKFSKRRNPFNHPAVMYKKSKVVKAGGYKDFKLFEDYYLWVRMLKAGCKGYNIQEPLLYMRAGAGLYERRGGISYVKQIVKFRWTMLRQGHAGVSDFVITAVGHSLIALVPGGIRRVFYERILRR